ncbi:GlxA family transcriptional regulator [Mesorhizobium denitrificans]|uniref:GlxA family transcriptional regulator n=2 Tax=Phyllobacteriaceae TaxID=69277 RepID=A0A371X418_9HYPH|nr:GlxA family transcriptional regulator [Mesorhizobium denitrificans]
MVLASAIEPLRVARDYSDNAQFTWRLLSVDGRDVTSSSGMTIRCDAPLNQARDLDILFVVAGYGARSQTKPALTKALQLVERRVPMLGALDSGAWLLASAGLLDGHKATIHWQDINQFSETHLNVEVVTDRYVMDGNRVTAGGATTVTDLMLKLIGDRGGGALAFDVSNMFVYDSRQRRPQDGDVVVRAPQLTKAVAIMRANVEHPIGLALLAAQAALSERTLARLFEREFGIGPGRYYQNIRLDVARSLVEETSLSASEIAARSGFASSSCLSRAYKDHFRHGLREARHSRRVMSRA